MYSIPQSMRQIPLPPLFLTLSGSYMSLTTFAMPAGVGAFPRLAGVASKPQCRLPHVLPADREANYGRPFEMLPRSHSPVELLFHWTPCSSCPQPGGFGCHVLLGRLQHHGLPEMRTVAILEAIVRLCLGSSSPPLIAASSRSWWRSRT